MDTLDVQELPIVAPKEVLALLKEEPVFFPPNVKVQAPSQHFEDAGYNRKWYVTAQISTDQLKNKTGPITLDNVPVQWFYKDHVTFATPTVRATLAVKQADVELEIKSLPVNLEMPPGMDDYRVEILPRDHIPNVTVIGPPDTIEKIRKNDPDARVRVVLPIDALAIPGNETRQKLEFRLPPGVKVSEETAEAASQWSYKLIRRQ